MLHKPQKVLGKVLVIAMFFCVCLAGYLLSQPQIIVKAQNEIASTAAPPFPAETPAFNRQEALAKLKEQIKGREKEPAGQVFKNIKMFREMPAGRLLAVMEMGYNRALGVDCTHCHIPDKWEDEEKNTKQIAREMAAMTSSINNQSLKNIKNLQSPSPLINCTTCHRGEIKPATNLPQPKS